MSTELRFGKRRITLPGSPAVRIGIGVLLVICGLVGFLPILGFWMVPLGLLVLSVDIPVVRRFRRKMEVKWGRWRQSRQNGREDEPAAEPSRVGQNREHEPDKT